MSGKAMAEREHGHSLVDSRGLGARMEWKICSGKAMRSSSLTAWASSGAEARS